MTSAATQASPAAHPPAPGLRKRLRRLPAPVRRHPLIHAVALLLLAMLLLRLGWGWQVDRQLRAVTDEIRGRGEPVELADIRFESLPDDQNGWVVFANAAAKLNLAIQSPRSSSIEYPHYPPYGKEWDALAEASEKAYAGEFAAVRRARGLADGQLRPRMAPLTQLNFTIYNSGRFLANTLADGAAYKHLRGEDGEAVERMRDGLHLARTMRRDPLLVSQLVAIGFDSLACDAIEQAAPALRIDASAPGAATPAQVRALIADLLDDEPVLREFRRAVSCERALTLDYFRTAGAQSWALRPVAGRAMVRALEDLEINVRAAAQDNAAGAKRMATGYHVADGDAGLGFFSSGAPKKTAAPRYSRWFEDGPLTFERAVEQQFRAIAERRGAATSLALNLYRADHGAFPDSLKTLVPAYLPKLPADPFREDGAPIGFIVRKGDRPDGADRPMICWDAGETDDVPIDMEPMFSWQTDPRKSGRNVRQYRDVTLWMPKVRRFDQQEAARQREAAEHEKEREELRKRIDEEIRESEAEAVDRDPGVPDAPRKNSEAERPGGGPAKQ